MIDNYWTLSVDDLARRLQCGTMGLSTAEAAARLKRHGRNQLLEHETLSRIRVLWPQLSSPLQLLLLFAALASAFTGEWTDAGIVPRR